MAPETQPSDSDLMRGMIAGDERAFVSLYRRWQGSLYRFALQMTGNSGLAEEITQEAFLALIREPRIFNPSRGSLQSLLFGICRNHIMRRIAEERRYISLAPISFDDANSLAEPVASSDLAANLAEAETVERVRKAVLALPPRHREVVVLCDLHEVSYEQAAVVLGCPVGTVRSRLHRARELLLAKLKRSAVLVPDRAVVGHVKVKQSNELPNLQDDCA
jgi:RNA polymerase sigma-70 factor, ECF subfamily